MNDELLVLLGGLPCGLLERRSGGRLRFSYFAEYGAMPYSTPLSVSMPKALRVFEHHVVDPWVQGLLPDNADVIKRWSVDFQVSPTPFSLLRTPIGEDCAGAVRFMPPDEVRTPSPDGIDWLDENGVAAILSGLKKDAAAWTGDASSGQFSLAGAQAKTALLYEDGRWGIPSGAIPTTHILKPPMKGLLDQDLNEHLCLAAASAAGLLTANTEIRAFGDQTALVVERYDRFVADGERFRLHQEDLCQAMGLSPTLKYQNEGGPTPSAIAALFRRVMAPAAAESAIHRFADALIWNWLIAGTDGHAKNYSLLLERSDVLLAPLYDIASLLPYGVDERKMKLAMKVGGSYEVFPRYNRWQRAARELGIDGGGLQARVLELANLAPDAFSDVASTLDGFESSMPSRLTDLVAARCLRCVDLINTTEPH